MPSRSIPAPGEQRTKPPGKKGKIHKRTSNCTHLHRLQTSKTATSETLGSRGSGERAAAERAPVETPG